jgi:hypothetical protein
MNIFALHDDAAKSAVMMCDKHVVKMVTESAQMLSTVHRVINGIETKRLSNSGLTKVKHWELPYPMEDVLMKACHVNHPCTQWARESDSNYMWLYEHYRALSDEYTYRYGKKHGAFYKNEIGFVLKNPPSNIDIGELTPFAKVMKQYPECIVESVVKSYRNYYLTAKKDFAKWTKREEPIWWSEAV